MRKVLTGPAFWGSLLLIISLVPAFYVASRGKVFAESNQFSPPQVSTQVPILYFFAAVAVIGVVLAVVPLSKLKIVLQVLFALLFGWGIFILLGLTILLIPAIIIAVAIALAWFFKPRVWFHNLVLVLALASMGSVFGFIISPWTAMILMLVIAVYDFLAVRFGYMMWMAKRLSESQAIPAFIIPRKTADWNLNLKNSFDRIFQGEAGERDFSILGGGDVGFPILLVISVYFAYGFGGALIVAAFSLLGLLGAYWIQANFLKGKPMPALPPIAVLSLIGFLIVLRFLAS